MTQVTTFSLGAIKQSAPALPAPLASDEFHTREQVRAHREAQQAFYDHQRDVEYQARVAIDNARAKELAEANREQTDAEYDALKREQWQAAKDKQAALVAKEKADQMEKANYLLSSPPVVELLHRSEFLFLKDFAYWVGQRGYTFEDAGMIAFQPGFYNVQLTAQAKKAVKQ